MLKKAKSYNVPTKKHTQIYTVCEWCFSWPWSQGLLNDTMRTSCSFKALPTEGWPKAIFLMFSVNSWKALPQSYEWITAVAVQQYTVCVGITSLTPTWFTVSAKPTPGQQWNQIQNCAKYIFRCLYVIVISVSVEKSKFEISKHSFSLQMLQIHFCISINKITY